MFVPVWLPCVTPSVTYPRVLGANLLSKAPSPVIVPEGRVGGQDLLGRSAEGVSAPIRLITLPHLTNVGPCWRIPGQRPTPPPPTQRSLEE